MSGQKPYNPGFVLPSSPAEGYYPPPHPPAPVVMINAGYPPYPSQGHGPPPSYPGQPMPTMHQPSHSQPGAYQPSLDWYKSPNIHDYLVNATMFRVKQKTELLEVMTGIETANQYSIYDQAGNKILFAAEEQDCCRQNACGVCRSFTINVRDKAGVDILRFQRGVDCGCCFGCFSPDRLTISSASGQLLGKITEDCHLINPKYRLKNATGSTILRVKGPAILCNTGFGPVEFRIKTREGVRIGSINKEWGGIVREMFTDADNFSITFPSNLDPSMKAVCLGCLFMIDFEYFESAGGRNMGNRRLFG